jgi:hypothetical protein
MLAYVFSAALVAQSVTAAVSAPLPVSAPIAVTAAGVPGELSDAEVQARLARIEAIYRARETYADYWYWGFGTLFAGASLVQTGIAVGTRDRLKRVDSIVGATTATLGVYAVATTPVRDGTPTQDLRKLPRCTPEDRRRSLTMAETMLRYDAAAEKRARKWTEHLNGVLVSGGAFAILYYGYGLKPQAWMKAASGVLFGQGRVLLAPQQARDGWREYQALYRPVLTTPEPTWGLIPFLSGAALTVKF